MYLINKFSKLKDSTVESTIKINDYVKLVKEGYDLTNLFKAREYPKGSDEYRSYKAERPAISFNCLFDDKRRNHNIKSGTGLLFFDIDDTDFDLKCINTSDFFILHKSFGGKGYSLIVKVEDIDVSSHESFKSSYLNIAEQLQINNFIDEGAVKRTQCTLLSYDNSIYVNYCSPIFNSNLKKYHEKDSNTKKEKESVSSTVQSVIPFLDTEVSRLKTKIVLDYYKEDCVYIPEGKEYVEVNIPFDKKGNVKKIEEGKRNIFISSVANNLIYINKTTNKQLLLNFIVAINESYLTKPLDESVLSNMIDYKIKRLKEGTLQPINAKQKKFWVNPKCKDKKKAYQNKRKSLSVNKIKNFLYDDLKYIKKELTYKDIADFCDVSYKTVQRKFKENAEYRFLLTSHNSKFTLDTVEDYFLNKISQELCKVTQKTVAERCGVSLPTIKRRFKDNPKYKKLITEHNIKIKQKDA